MGIYSTAFKLFGSSFEKVGQNLLKKGLKPLVNEAERTITYTTRKGVQKRLLFNAEDKVSHWTSINPNNGKMKVFNRDEFLGDSITKIEKFENYSTPVETQKIVTKRDYAGKIESQNVETYNHLTGVTTKHSNPVLPKEEPFKFEPPPIEDYNPLKNDPYNPLNTDPYDPLNPNRFYDPYNDPYAQINRDIEDAAIMSTILNEPYLF